MDLNDNEKAILQRLVRGESDEEIAATTKISRRNVKYYVGRLLRFFDVPNRARLIALYWEGERQTTLAELNAIKNLVKKGSPDAKDRVDTLIKTVQKSLA